MKRKIGVELESTGYRCLFEGIKKEGIEPFLNLAKDIERVPQKEILIRQTLFSGSNDLDLLEKKHRDIVKYFQEHKEQFTIVDITNSNVLKVLENLSQNRTLLALYLENARKLEELKVKNIEFVNDWFDWKNKACKIYRNAQDEIILIFKYYTDGHLETDGKEILVDKLFNYREIYFSITPNDEMSFIFEADNTEHQCQYRRIYIENFGFDGTKLPSEKEIQRYAIPEEFMRKRIK